MTTAIRDAVSPDLRATLRALKLGQMLHTLPDRLTLGRQQKMAHADGHLGPGRSVRYDQQLWNELASLRFLDAHRGTLPLGPVGVGKTHLACAFGHIAIRRRRGVPMARAGKWFKRLKAARLDNTLEYQMRRLATIELLIIDDLALQPLDAASTTDFYELCVERHQRAATVVTSNRTPDEWLAMMAGPPLAQSVRWSHSRGKNPGPITLASDMAGSPQGGDGKFRRIKQDRDKPPGSPGDGSGDPGMDRFWLGGQHDIGSNDHV